MKNIGIVLLVLATVLSVSCKRTPTTYKGPDIVYFDQTGNAMQELAESNKVLNFRVTSPLKASYDRQYVISRTFGSTLEDGVNYTIKDKIVTIKAGEYWVDGAVEFIPASLTPNVDTLALKIAPQPGAGEVATFDNVYKMCVSKRCEVVLSEYVGKYLFKTTFPGNYGAEKEVDITLAMDANNEPIPNTLNVVDWFGSGLDGGGDVKIELDMSDPGRGVIPVVKLQKSRSIQLQDGEMVQGYVSTPEQIDYPNLPASANNSSLKTCSKNFRIYLTWGVFKFNPDGSERSGHIEGTPCLETLTFIPPTPAEVKHKFDGDNIECRTFIESAKY